MKMYVRALGVLAAAGVLLAPSVAAQAAAATPTLTALTERTDAGLPVSYPIHPGETISPVLGVVNSSSETVAGVVVWIHVLNDVDLPKEFTNCQYYVDSNLDGAFCEINQKLPVGESYELSPFHVSATADATELSSIVFRWYTKAQADAQGGIEAMAAAAAHSGTAPAAGTGGELALTARDLPPSPEPNSIGFSYLKLVTASPSPSGSASPSPTASASSSPAGVPATTAPADASGLPVTGSKTAAAAGIGALLLLAGTIGFLLARRRRTRFVA